MLGVTDDLIEERDEARAELARLREEQDTFLSGHVATLQHQLATANALLGLVLESGLQPSLDRRIRAHLSSAAPAQTVTVQSGAGPVEVTREHRLKAEQAVLDAMRQVRQGFLLAFSTCEADGVGAMCRAELARRGVTP